MIAVARPRLVDAADDEPHHDPRILLLVVGEATRRLHRMGPELVDADEWDVGGLCASLAAEIGVAMRDLPTRTVGAGVLEAVKGHVRSLRRAWDAGRAAG